MKNKKKKKKEKQASRPTCQQAHYPFSPTRARFRPSKWPSQRPDTRPVPAPLCLTGRWAVVGGDADTRGPPVIPFLSLSSRRRTPNRRARLSPPSLAPGLASLPLPPLAPRIQADRFVFPLQAASETADSGYESRRPLPGRSVPTGDSLKTSPR